MNKMWEYILIKSALYVLRLKSKYKSNNSITIKHNIIIFLFLSFFKERHEIDFIIED